MRATRIALSLVCLVALGSVAGAESQGDARLASKLPEPSSEYAERIEAGLRHPDRFDAQIAAAEFLLRSADRLRNERKIRSEMPSDRNKAHRQQQRELADEALPFAERALALAPDAAHRAQAERVIGELYAHRISGFFSGLVNGPRAQRHIQRAIELAPDDPECQRAIGLMYLNNPPINGGDVPRAVETFAGCAAEIPDDRCLVLLAMSHRKAGSLTEARAAAAAALERNPESLEAVLLLEELP